MAAVSMHSPSPTPDTPSHRSSMMSTSAASYTTAPLAESDDASRDSLHTIGPNAVNPMHILSRGMAQHAVPEVHVRKVSQDKVSFSAGEQHPPLLQKVGNTVNRALEHVYVPASHPNTAATYEALPKPSTVSSHLRTITSANASNEAGNNNIDGIRSFTPPPSPPASVGPHDDSARPTGSPSKPQVQFASRLTAEPSETSLPIPTQVRDFAIPATSTAPPLSINPEAVTPPPPRASPLPKRASTSIIEGPQKTALPTLIAPPQIAGTSQSPTIVRAVTEIPDAPIPSSTPMQIGAASSSKQPPTGDFLHPSSANNTLSPRAHGGLSPTRRNTTGSSLPMHRTPRNPTILPGSIPPSSFGAGAYASEDGNATGSAALDSEILKEAEQIRRERTKRLKQQQEKEIDDDGAGPSVPTHGRRTSFSSKSIRDTDPKVLVGNLIGEDHVNYVLMYNMLTGIRIAVSRCQAKIRRPLTDDDYTAAHKYSFDIIGNELTPSAKYDFKFKDYAPFVFRELREDYFRIDPSDYLVSLTAKYILSELGSPGKSGSFFYFSRDYRFIIKTISHTEHKFLRHILRDYYNHVKTNPHTLLSRFYGLHRVKLPRGRKIHFVIMNNLFPPHRDIHETFDLKGSTVGRLYPEEKAAKNPRAVMKDLNWLSRHRQLELGPEKRAYLSEQLKRDSDLMKRLNVMDYSLLVGIHNMQRGNRDNVRRNTLKVFQPDVSVTRRNPSQPRGKDSEATAMRRAMRQSDLQELAPETHLPEPSADLEHFIFYQDEGGYRATDEGNRPLDTIYYLGIIDICTPYTFFKRAEHFWKGLSADRHKISPVPAEEYGDRFYSFLNAVTRGGEGGERFKAE